MMWWMPFGFGFGWLMMAGIIIFWAGIIFLIVWGIRKLTERNYTTRGNALEIARERYAKGEISREEFDQIKKDLS